MSYCYHPLKAIRFYHPDRDEYTVKVLKGEYDPSLKSNTPNTEFIPLPCGRCVGCRLQYSRIWADRCMLEAQYHDSNYFLTLTYDDSHLPECRPGSPVHSLVKRDLQLFFKRLRKDTGQKFRYFACGEYSPRNRPHYHIILFGLKLDDLIIHKRDFRTGNIYYISPTIDAAWYPESESHLPRNERSINGYHLLTDVTWDTCAYTARYVMKKQKGQNSQIYEDLNYQPEFTLMSRKPGIARQFYEDHNDIVVNPYYIPTKEGHITVRSNKYFDSLFDIDYPNDLEFIKGDRIENNQMSEFLKDSQTSMSYKERLLAEEANKMASVKSLKRKEVL